MKIENDKAGMMEKCFVCGKELKEGDGRFRMPDLVCCMDCHGWFRSIGAGNHPEPESSFHDG